MTLCFSTESSCVLSELFESTTHCLFDCFNLPSVRKQICVFDRFQFGQAMDEPSVWTRAAPPACGRAKFLATCLDLCTLTLREQRLDQLELGKWPLVSLSTNCRCLQQVVLMPATEIICFVPKGNDKMKSPDKFKWN